MGVHAVAVARRHAGTGRGGLRGCRLGEAQNRQETDAQNEELGQPNRLRQTVHQRGPEAFQPLGQRRNATILEIPVSTREMVRRRHPSMRVLARARRRIVIALASHFSTRARADPDVRRCRLLDDDRANARAADAPLDGQWSATAMSAELEDRRLGSRVRTETERHGRARRHGHRHSARRRARDVGSGSNVLHEGMLGAVPGSHA